MSTKMFDEMNRQTRDILDEYMRRVGPVRKARGKPELIPVRLEIRVSGWTVIKVMAAGSAAIVAGSALSEIIRIIRLDLRSRDRNPDRWKKATEDNEE
jgi:hypothetical protein